MIGQGEKSFCEDAEFDTLGAFSADVSREALLFRGMLFAVMGPGTELYLWGSSVMDSWGTVSPGAGWIETNIKWVAIDDLRSWWLFLCSYNIASRRSLTDDFRTSGLPPVRYDLILHSGGWH